MPKKPPARPRCSHTTRAGAPCTRYALVGTKHCRRHRPKNTPPDRPEPDWEKFLAELDRSGMVSHAAREIGIHRQRAYEHRAEDPDFAARWDETIERTTDVMEREAFRRAVAGVEKPVFQGGQQVGNIREHSDTLLIFLLKARRPDTYRERHSVEHTGPAGGPLEHRMKVDLSGLTDEQLAALEALHGNDAAGPEPR